MPTVKLHYDGWVSLPSSIRQKLGLNSGHRLEADLVNGAIVLRPAIKASIPAPHDEQASNPPAADVPETLTPQAATLARRKPGRPRKVEAADELAPAAQPKRPRGRPKAALVPAPAPVDRPVARSEPWKLRRKEDLQPKAASEDQPPLPSGPPIGPRPRQATSSRSAVRFAMSRCASSDRDADTTGLADILTLPAMDRYKDRLELAARDQHGCVDAGLARPG